jgi:hypothetical protein
MDSVRRSPSRWRSEVETKIAEWIPRLEEIRREWAASLPEAATTWRKGAVYVRESSALSLALDAPDAQLRQALGMLANKQAFVGEGAVFFDVESGTDVGPRAAFRRMFEESVAGGFDVVGAYVNERLFRNLAQAQAYKRQFRVAGIDLAYLGRYEGDQRNPAAWQTDVMLDTNAELHARTTSYQVGMHFEILSRKGRPTGRIPEVYVPGERAPSFLGRRGAVISWTLHETLASILRQGKDRFLLGDSLKDLSVWSATTELGGVTPNGAEMNRGWWYHALKNPRFAGYQAPTQYMGFKPGKESPKRPSLTVETELVPCVLPALWTLEEYYELRRVMDQRWKSPKVRGTYRSYLLSGVAYDADCGHRLMVSNKQNDGRFHMKCNHDDATAVHQRSRRADVAQAELDALLGGLQFSGPALERMVEEELRKRADEAAAERKQFRTDPAIASARQALAALAGTEMHDLRAELEQRINKLESADGQRRVELAGPYVDFKRALRSLRRWNEVWPEADMTTKNQLLREAGVTVYLAPAPGLEHRRKGRPYRVHAITAANPALQHPRAVPHYSPKATIF